jgi:iron complex outermembrane receptor protein
MINDVGAYTRTNISDSYRAGVELQGALKFNSWLNASANLSLSRNKVKDFSEFIDDYDNGNQKVYSYKNPDIAFSPSVVGSFNIAILPVKNIELNVMGKYVSDQYLDNTQNENRKLDAFFVQNARVIYTYNNKWLKELSIIAQVNNLFYKKYQPNGYSFSYIYGGAQTTENYYFPMAGRNFMVGVNVKF